MAAPLKTTKTPKTPKTIKTSRATKPLSPKQEKFCQCIASGMTGKESYLDAYNSESEAAAWVESNKLLLREDIQERIKELRKPVEEAVQLKAISAKDAQIQFIMERIQICKANDDEQSIIRYTDMLNKLHGLYKESSTEQAQDNNLANVDMDTLQKLVAL